MTLDEFMAHEVRWSLSRWIDVPGFVQFYAKKGQRWVNGEKHDNVFVLSNIEAENPGSGTLRGFLKDFWNKYDVPVMVECVQSERLCDGLRRMGFVDMLGHPNCFIKMKGNDA